MVVARNKQPEMEITMTATKLLFAASIASILGFTGIAAAQTPAPIGKDESTVNVPAKDAVKAPPKDETKAAKEAPAAPAATDTPSDCRAVTFTRPDVGSHRKFTLTFRSNADMNAIKACNPGADIDRTESGVRIVITYGDAGATVKLPTSMSGGSVNTGRCVNDKEGEVSDVVLYRAAWDGKPPKVELAVVGKEFFDYAKLLNACKKLNDEHKFH